MDQFMTTSKSLPMSNKDVELVTDYGLDVLAALLHETAIEKGFWSNPKNFDVFFLSHSIIRLPSP